MTVLVGSTSDRAARPSANSPALRVAAGVGLGLLVQVLIGVTMAIVFAGRPELVAGWPWLSPAVTHAAMLAYALALILLLSRGHPNRFGLQRPAALSRGVFLLPAALSIVVSGVSRLLHVPGLPFVGEYSVWQQILLIWVFASVAEETLTRGLIQGFLAPLSDRGFTVRGMRLSVPVLTGALFFAAMHLLLFTIGVPTSTVLLIVLFAFFLGIIAGIYREATRSLVPAILAHATANAAGGLADWLIASF